MVLRGRGDGQSVQKRPKWTESGKGPEKGAQIHLFVGPAGVPIIFAHICMHSSFGVGPLQEGEAKGGGASMHKYVVFYTIVHNYAYNMCKYLWTFTNIRKYLQMYVNMPYTTAKLHSSCKQAQRQGEGYNTQ